MSQFFFRALPVITAKDATMDFEQLTFALNNGDVEGNSKGELKLVRESVTGTAVNKEVPKITGAYTALTVRAEGHYLVSATRPALVDLSIAFSATETAALEILVGGVKLGGFTSVKPAVAEAPTTMTTFLVPANVEWEWKKLAGAVEVKSSYLTL